jgi:hypothetical protein
MTIRTINVVLQAALFGGALNLVPAFAYLVPDHAQAEARGGGETTISTEEKTEKVPDHVQAEARGAAGTVVPSAEKTAGVPDHATGENRGAVDTE